MKVFLTAVFSLVLSLGLSLVAIFMIGACAHSPAAKANAEPAAAQQLPPQGLDKNSPAFYQFTPDAIDGSKAPLASYKGKLVMVVNTASKCGYTPQYEGLENLYKKYQDKGFVILGFPSNDFGGQEPGTNAEIHTFCKVRYGVTFPLFDKNPVTGAQKQPLYQYLTTQGPEGTHGEVNWNFEKFLISPSGEIVARWRSKVEPMSGQVEKKISEFLPAVAKNNNEK